MKNGSCKFGSACKYNHPKQASGLAQQLVALNSLGFPHRPVSFIYLIDMFHHWIIFFPSIFCVVLRILVSTNTGNYFTGNDYKYP